MPGDPSGRGGRKSLPVTRRDVLKAAGVAGLPSVPGLQDLASAQAAGQRTVVEREVPERPETYRTASTSAFQTLNPLYSTGSDADTAVRRALDPGYTFDEDGEFFPLLYDMSTENGEVWVFELREDLRFGDPYGRVTAADFVYQIQELHQSSWAPTPSTGDWLGVNVEQTGRFEFQAELQRPRPLWPDTYSPQEYPVPKGLVEPYVQREDDAGLRDDGQLVELQFTGNLGPYVLEEWERDRRVTYSRNDDYYLRNADYGPTLFEAAPYFDTAEIAVLPERPVRLAALEIGEVESARIPTDRVRAFERTADVDVRGIPTQYNSDGLLAVNMRDNGWSGGPGNLFRHAEFRQALAAAISKPTLVEDVQFGYGNAHVTWQPRFSEWYPGDGNLQTWGVGDRYGEEVATALARDAFEESEHDYRFDGGDLVTPGGDQVTLDLYARADSATNVQTAEVVRDELDANLGLDVSVETIQRTRFSTEYWSAAETAEPGTTRTINGREYTWDEPRPTNPGPREFTSENAWDMSVVFGLNTFPRDPLGNQAFFDGPTASYNPVGYYPEFDAQQLFQRLREATSRGDVRTAATELFEKLNGEQPYVTLVLPEETVGYNADLAGPTDSFYNGWDVNAWHYTGQAVAAYTNETDVVDTEGLRDAVDDWQDGDIGTDLLGEVIDAWRSTTRSETKDAPDERSR